MLNHIYTSVKNANLVDCGKKQHIASQPSPLLKDNFLGEFRTELDKKKVLANLGVATDLSLEWEYIKGDIGRSEALMQELDSRTTYTSVIDGFKKTLIEGIAYLETVIGGELDSELVLDSRLEALETLSQTLQKKLEDLLTYLTESIEIDLNTLQSSLEEITQKVNNITELIQVSSKEGNALVLISPEQVEEGTTPGLYVPDLSGSLTEAELNIKELLEGMSTMQDTLSNFVTKDDLGGGDFDFVALGDFDTYVQQSNTKFSDINIELAKTVKTGEDGHVDTLYVNTISKNNNEESIKITDSFEVTSNIPLDIRCVVENLEELCSLPVKVCYSGMGVIVNSLSALYILRKPQDDAKLTQEYISNVYNWKCPEDLVTVALSREDYENLEEKNPNVFYYVFEEEIKRTEAPNRDSFDLDEEYNEAFQDWLDSLKILSEEYMSASWGVGIEKKVSEKANKTDINALQGSITSLQELINNISGGDSETSLSSLVERVTSTEEDLQFLLGTEGNDEEPSTVGKISEIEESIQILDDKVESDYVTKASITDETNTTDYIFLKKSDYVKDVLDKELELSLKVTTEAVEALSVTTNQVNLSELPLTSDGESLMANTKPLAFLENVPKMSYLSLAEYDAKVLAGEIDPDTYYYTSIEESYITETKFNEKIGTINNSIGASNKAVTDLQNSVSEMQTLIASLLITIETLKTRIDVLEGNEAEPSE